VIFIVSGVHASKWPVQCIRVMQVGDLDFGFRENCWIFIVAYAWYGLYATAWGPELTK